jgi:hypothetical protein
MQACAFVLGQFGGIERPVVGRARMDGEAIFRIAGRIGEEAAEVERPETFQ